MSRRVCRLVRLALRPMEDRIVPAFSLAIDGDVPTSNVSSALVAGAWTFTPTGAGATLNVDDIEAALTTGDVLITTGSGGTDPGNVDWVLDSVEDNLVYAGDVVRTLTIRPDSTSTVGNVTLDGVALSFNDNIDLTIDTTAPAIDGQVALHNTTVNAARNVVLRAGNGNINVDSPNIEARTGDVTLSGNTVLGGANYRSGRGDVTVSAKIDAEFAGRADHGTVALNGAVNGAHIVKLAGDDVTIGADIGAITPLTKLFFSRGQVHYGSRAVRASQIFAGDFDLSDGTFAYLEGTGPLTGDVFVASDGSLAPGGLGVVGNMIIDGNLQFFGGSYAVDLGPTSDQIVLIGSGNVLLDDGGFLGGPGSTGLLSGSGDVKLIDFPGNLTGAFFNAPAVGSKLVLGFDAAQLTHFGPASTGVTVARLPAAPGGVVSGTEFDGTRYTARLTGGGELVGFTDVVGDLDLVARGTGALSRITVSTKANASDDTISLGPVRITGRLAAFSAPRADQFGGLAATGPVGVLSLARVIGSIALGGTATDRSSIRAESILTGSTPDTTVTTPGILTSLTTTGSFNAGLQAAAIGAVHVGGTLSSIGQNPDLAWNVAGGVASVTAAEIQSLTLNARNLGTLSATGSLAQRLPGDIYYSTFRLAGNDGTPARFGLKSVRAPGIVEGATFDVQEGNVGTVTVGRFRFSNLFLDYLPQGDFNTGGTFGSSTHFKVASFTTTALPIGDPANLLNWAFAGSQVVADTIGTMRLSGLRTDNSLTPFGIKFRTAATSVQVKSVGPGAVPLNINLTPGAMSLAGEFFFLDV